MNAIEIHNLKKSFADFSLHMDSLTLPQGCIMGLIGENGAGKSTTIRSILGMTKYEGDIKVLEESLSPALKNRIGVVMDEVGFCAAFTPKNVNSIMKNSFTEWDETAFFSYLKQFSLPEKKGFGKYSKGMKMKLMIAIAMSHHADLLILDEPTSGLDPLARDEIIDILNDFTREENHSILISSHIVSDLEKLCDYIAFLHKGELMLCEEKDVLLSEYAFLNTSEAQLAELNPAAIRGKKVTAWGTEALVCRSMIPAGFEIKPISIEDLFVFMAKEAK